MLILSVSFSLSYFSSVFRPLTPIIFISCLAAFTDFHSLCYAIFFYPLSLSFHHYSFSYLSLCMCYSSYLCVVILHSLTPPHTHTKTSLRIIIQFNTHTQHAPVGLDTNLNPSLDRDTVTVCVRRGREGLALPMPMMDNCQGTARPSGLIFSMRHTHRRWR